MKRHILRFALGLLLLPILGACTDEQVVFRDRELFIPPVAAALNFLGYSDTTRNLPVCGNCHTETYSRWKGTAHAHAWATLQANSGKQALCEGCHTVNALGNTATGNAGYLGVKDARYEDVQCESCHGPGLQHVQNVQNANADPRPFAPLRVDTALTLGCGECHSGTHHPFVQEWRRSAHGSVPNQNTPGGRAECQECHTGEDALNSWGIRSKYLEKDSVLGNSTRHLPITCGVCHDPHSNAIPGQLRFAVDVPSEGNNLCMKCHHKRGTPDQTTFRGPHSPEGPVLLGYGGWWPPNLKLELGDTAFATHGSERNPKLCAGCHLVRFTVTDPQSGNFQFQSTGHLFLATPCLNAQGLPQPGDCAPTQRTYRTCVSGGCHATEAVARTLEATAKAEVAVLATALDNLLRQIHTNWNTCRTNNSCGAGSPFNTMDATHTTAEGAAFNWDLARYPVKSGVPEYSSVVHNPPLIKALLTASMTQLRRDYNVTMPPGLVLQDVRDILRRR
jgi:predicted CXXCH cytochrome family protein